eukprot:CAMPEP_0170417434 /NCGR_PEP_ID=MMETSP0117_2-20130122/33709_1 /TAXON_ID=400756 /ORGANISM="Durinskia baltica, Strain CSIRO CS-38" /LENGTH=44 /DNA_ID= /DNA_START= /DNA_END= /DNA_ORIENTATION=
MDGALAARLRPRRVAAGPSIPGRVLRAAGLGPEGLELGARHLQR